MIIHKRCYMCNRSFRCTHNYFYQHSYIKCKGCLNRVNLGVCRNISEEEFNNTGRYRNRYCNSYQNYAKQQNETIVHVEKKKREI